MHFSCMGVSAALWCAARHGCFLGRAVIVVYSCLLRHSAASYSAYKDGLHAAACSVGLYGSSTCLHIHLPPAVPNASRACSPC